VECEGNASKEDAEGEGEVRGKGKGGSERRPRRSDDDWQLAE
jgi:hypothetical protein